MNRLFLAIGAAMLLAACTSEVPAPPALPPVDAPVVVHPEIRSDLQRFYNWYLMGEESRSVAELLAERPGMLDSSLRVLLEADQKCAAESKEVCKLDFDPFVNAQDLCVMYQVREPRQVADLVEFPVYAGCMDDVQDTTPRLFMVVLPQDSGWVVKDIRYPRGQSLVALLRDSTR